MRAFCFVLLICAVWSDVIFNNHNTCRQSVQRPAQCPAELLNAEKPWRSFDEFNVDGPGFKWPPSEMLTIEAIRPNSRVFALYDGVYMSTLVTTAADGSTGIMIGAPTGFQFTETDANGVVNIVALVRRINPDIQVTHLIIPHGHADHTGAWRQLQKAWPSIIFVGSETTEKWFRSRLDADNRMKLDVLVPRGVAQTFTYGDQTAVIQHTEEVQHLDGNVMVYFPAEKFLHFVDVVVPGWSPFRSNSIGADVVGLVTVTDALLAVMVDNEWLLNSGHVTKLGNRDDVLQTKAYYADLVSAALAGVAFAGGQFAEITQRSGAFVEGHPNFRNMWAVFDLFIDIGADHCRGIMEPKWAPVLFGADLFLESACESMVEKIRLE
eukprot:NODE_781_length_1346_cov_331.396299_g591_i0.p1 GENE.NODE_781_length_1346_cov_331.396299_g591_i0~~NODE_781_length_1346_cov_331.396299_g591_i0.p1  ORF type:complete len:399 (+),score=82.79 NODE_781_length_1346_cov_331.396299_g591_i0:59-1198(+)